ncbi:MAG TPA: c-type cytochrome [Povalibacter sp.]|uniref:c-type cytochrome n=1 Tax=Povalibacter sp. TaxID=1962978 RepID=UPI002C564040|nr:c-type cytochrome [Povalibacter sp.]HMN46105.1 c-type cytochrome [Povalibacter sp.]
MKSNASIAKRIALSLVAVWAATSLPVQTFASDEALMERGGCISCHRVDQKLLGPSFKEVAARHRGDPQAAARLFAKVREGGEGEWGDLPMQPNGEEKISDENLQAVIAWILSLQ